MKVIRLKENERFSAEKVSKVSLFDTERFFCDLYCLEPGQAQKAHVHQESDKVYVVLEGVAHIEVGADAADVGSGQATIAPAGAMHGLANRGPGRLVLLVFLAPKPA